MQLSQRERHSGFRHGAVETALPFPTPDAASTLRDHTHAGLSSLLCLSCSPLSIDRGLRQRSHVSLGFCECWQVIIPKGDTDLAYKISPMYRESLVVPLSQSLLPPSDMCVAAGCTARSSRQDMGPRGGAPWDTVTTRHNG